jgi:acyl dehydratase
VSASILHYEDVEVGRQVAFGSKVVTREEIVAFARAFDPQPFHLDEELAKGSMIGRLCASGWHSCAILMRMLADDILNRSASLGSPGMEDVRWLKPVFPGDRLSGRYTCLEKRVMRSRPGVGLCRMLFELVNGDGEAVMTWDTQQMFACREAASPAAGGRA